MPTRDRMIIIINQILNDGSGKKNNNNNNNGMTRDRAFWKAVIRDELTKWSIRDWAAWCKNYGGYTEAEWTVYFSGPGDYNLEEWTCWMLLFYGI